MKDRLPGYFHKAPVPPLRPGGARQVRLDPRKLLLAWRRRTGLFFAVLAGTLGIVVVATFLRQPVYQAQAEVVFGGERDDAASAIRSAAMAAQVAAALHLATDPEFAAGHGIFSQFHTLFAATAPRAANPSTSAGVADQLRRNLAVVRPANTLAITISYTAADAATAARIANAYALAYTGRSPAASTGGDYANGRIISLAAVPLVPASPAPVIGVVIGLVLGAVLGLGAAVLSEMRFAGLTSAADVRDRLWLPYLGSVPALASVLPNARSAPDAVADFPMSAFTEAFRSLWTAIQGNGSERPQVVAIAASVAGEGGTTIAVCLARILALRGEQVVLVDCTVGGGASAMLGSAAGTAGLDEVLNGRAMLAAALVLDERSGAFFLPNRGSSESRTDRGDGSEMKRLIDDLRARFRHVLIATGPLATSAEAVKVAVMADAIVVVIRWRATAERVIAAALQQLRGQGGRIAGAALSQVDMRKQVRYSADEATIYQQQFSKYYS